MPQVGEMRELVQFETNLAIEDTAHGRKPNWVPVGRPVSAKVEWVDGTEQRADGAVVATRQYLVTIRYQVKVQAARWRARWRGRVLDILSVEPNGYGLQEWIVLRCDEGVIG